MHNHFWKCVLTLTVPFAVLGCTSINVQKPEINKVKKIAIVSVSSNYYIHDVKDQQQDQNNADLAALGKTLTNALTEKTKAESVKAQVQIVTHGTASLSTMLSKINGWTSVPVADVIANPAYQAMFFPKAAEETKTSEGTTAKGVASALLQKLSDSSAVSDIVVPAGMGKVPYALVVPPKGTPSTVRFVNNKKVLSETEQTLASLGRLCEELGVDAIVVAQVKLSYQKGFITVSQGGGLFGLFGEERETRETVVETDIAIVDSKGKLVLSTKDGWKNFTGKSAPLILKGEVDLADKKGECVKSYNAVIDASVTELSGRIAKALQ